MPIMKKFDQVASEIQLRTHFHYGLMDIDMDGLDECISRLLPFGAKGNNNGNGINGTLIS